jgi:hypothetical protein
MANEIQALAPTGSTVYAVVSSANALVWNGTAFEAYQTARLALYAIAMTEQGTASGRFVGNFPAGAGSGCSAVAYVRAGGAPAEGDQVVAAGPIDPPVTIADSVAAVTGAAAFTGSSGLSATNGFYLGAALVFTSGALKGIARKVTGYTGATRAFAFATAFPAAPSVGDRFELLGRLE